MINDILIKLSALCTNNSITNEEYTNIYNILMEAKDRQSKPFFKNLSKKLNEQYKDKLVYEHSGGLHSFGYPIFEAKSDRICMYVKPHYRYNKDFRSIESRFSDFHYTTIWENDCDTRIKPITIEEMEQILKTLEGVDAEYILNKFKSVKKIED